MNHGHGHDHHHSHMPESFDDVEKYAERFEDPRRDEYHRFAELFQEFGPLGAGDQVAVDIGGGTGYLARKLAATGRFRRVFSVDVSDKMTEYARSKLTDAEKEIVVPLTGQPDGFELPERCNVIVTANTYHHIDERETYFRRLAEQHAADGCTLLVIDFRADQKNMLDGEEFGPKEEWGKKVPADEVQQTIEATGRWKQVKRVVYEFHYNIFFQLQE